jgi:hypothetical protein
MNEGTNLYIEVANKFNINTEYIFNPETES